MATQLKDVVKSYPDAFTERRIYTSDDVFAQEMRKIFRKAWLFVGHEDEVRAPGAFLRVTVANQPLLMVRGQDGVVRVLFNTCRHRASIVEPRESGKCTQFKCPYHGFTYDTTGALIEVPVRTGYSEWFDQKAMGLVPVPRQESFNGLVFVSFDANAVSFSEYLGEAKEYLQYGTTADDGKLVVVDSYKYDIGANWKLLIDNTMDGYHVPFVHAGPIDSRQGGEAGIHQGFTQALGIHGRIEWPEDKPLRTRAVNRYMAIFPNICINYNAGGDMYGIRQIEPISPGKMRVKMFLLAPESSDRETNLKRAAKFSVTWGPGGLFGADDAMQLELVQEGMRADCDALVLAARSLEAGHKGDYDGEQPLRGFRRGWSHYMSAAD